MFHEYGAAENWNRQRLAPLLVRNGLVVAGHPLAAAAGAGVLMQGGNAVDAAIALSAVLGVVRPQMCGLGGDLLMQVYWAADRQVHALNANGPAPRAANLARFSGGLPRKGPLAPTVPGQVGGWAAAHERFGSRPWSSLLQPAIDYAEQGFPVYTRFAFWSRSAQDVYRDYPRSVETLLPNGSPPQVGEIFRQPRLTRTLRTLADEGAESFYRGGLARRLVGGIREAGGLIDEQDLADLTLRWESPVRGSYRGYTVTQQPPSSQGYVIPQMLNMLEPEDARRLGWGTVELVDLLVRAKIAAFAERDRTLGDPTRVSVPLDRLLDKRHARRLLAESAVGVPSSSDAGETTAFSVVDRDGNAVTAIQSLYFDSGVVAGDTGILLNGRMNAFSLDPVSPNVLAPGKRPLYTMNTWMVLSGGRLRFMGGTPGGHGQVQTNLQVLLNLIDFEMSPQEAVEAPRWVHGDVVHGGSGSRLSLEGRYDPQLAEGLRARGYDVDVVDDWSEMTHGSAKIIEVTPVGILSAGCDPRRDAQAVGF